MIIARAATMFSNGEILEGHDYGNISNLAHKFSYPMDQRIYGFVTSTDEFVLPKEAMEIAVQAGQTTPLTELLTPEQLWPTNYLELSY